MSEQISNVSVTTPTKIKKKRGRKANIKYYSNSIRRHIPDDFSQQEADVLHIDITNLDNNDNDNNKDNDKDIKNNNIDVAKGILETDINHGYFNEIFGDNDNDDNVKNNNNIDIAEGIFETDINHGCFNGNGSVLEQRQQLIQQKNKVDQTNNIKRGFYQILSEYHLSWTCDQTTDKLCWWCVHPFSNVPLGCPTYFDKDTIQFRVKGIFCSFGCVYAYMKEQYNFYDKKYLLKHMYTKLTANDFKLLKPAPSRYTLNVFGGLLTIEQFRQVSKEARTYKMIHYPLYMSRDYVAEVDLAHVKSTNSKFIAKTTNVLDSTIVNEAKMRIASKKANEISKASGIESFIIN
jgi:hypothetical protein